MTCAVHFARCWGSGLSCLLVEGSRRLTMACYRNCFPRSCLPTCLPFLVFRPSSLIISPSSTLGCRKPITWPMPWSGEAEIEGCDSSGKRGQRLTWQLQCLQATATVSVGEGARERGLTMAASSRVFSPLSFSFLFTFPSLPSASIREPICAVCCARSVLGRARVD